MIGNFISFLFLFSVEDYNHTEKNIEIVSPKSDENNMLGQIESLPKNNKTQ